jgi:two-component system alkaline phosphatase synthesis response regulator PhoP
MANAKVLVVDDDRKTVDLARLYLEKDGYRILTAYDGKQALDMARQKKPDLVVLDLMLPGLDGFDICRVLRAEGNAVPIIMLTARTLDEDKLLALDLGADDYVTKPFSPRELVARVRAVLRRMGEAANHGPDRVACGDLVVDFVRHEVRRNGQGISLTPTEFKLLEILVKDRGRAFTRLELLDRVFGVDYDGMERTIDVHVMNLRRKIEIDASNPCGVVTVPGVGYRFEDDDVP